MDFLKHHPCWECPGANVIPAGLALVSLCSQALRSGRYPANPIIWMPRVFLESRLELARWNQGMSMEAGKEESERFSFLVTSNRVQS